MCECDFDNIFLGIMTIISGLIVFVDLKVLQKMFEEYFMMSHYLDSVTYNECYKPQSEMRICLECYAIFCAVICTALTGCLSFNLSDSAIEWVA